MILKGQKKEIDIKCSVEAEDDLGKVTKDSLIVTVRVYPQSQRIEMLKNISDILGVDFINEHLVKFRELRDADGKEVPYSKETLKEVLEVGPYYDAILDGVKQGVFGKRLHLKLKN